MSKKFIPNGDLDFLTMARKFASEIGKDPNRYEVPAEEAASLVAAVDEFEDAYQAVKTWNGRSPLTIRQKEAARQRAERLIRDIALAVRANRRLGELDRFLLGIRERSTRAKHLTVPAKPPRLRFLRALHEGNGAVPVHELEFRESDQSTTAKPQGAVRLELFVDMVPPEEPIPQSPMANLGGRPWYLRSYTKSPIVLQPPMPRVPMRIVYWGRWADSLGNVGPFSATAVGWTEGGAHRVLPSIGNHLKPLPRIEDYAQDGLAHREKTYVVALLEEQCRSLTANAPLPQLPGTGDIQPMLGE